MHSSGSLLRTFCSAVRQYLDDPDVDAKYDNSYLVNLLMVPAMTDVIARINMMSDTKVLLRFTITTVVGQQYYVLPPSVGEVWRLAILDEQGNVTDEAMPRGQFHPSGPNWYIEGNMLAIRPFPQEARELDVWYVPSGEIAPLYDSAGGTLAGTSFTLPATAPTIGRRDLRPHAYAGMYLRLLTANTHEERMIAAYDVATRVCTLRAAPSVIPNGGSIDFEIVPALMESQLEAVACRVAMKLAVGGKYTDVQRRALAVEYRSALKTALDTSANTMARMGKAFDGLTVDNERYQNYLFRAY